MLSESLKILVVDDIVDNLFLLQTVLEAEGYLTETAINGTIALRQFQASPPNLVLLDIMMPGLNGYEVARRIRQHSSVPIVFMTAHDELSIFPYREIGVNDLIRKPIDFDELLSKITNVTTSLQQSSPLKFSDSGSFERYEISYSCNPAQA